MAWVNRPVIKVTFIFRDNDGKSASTEVPVPFGTGFDEAAAFAVALRPLIAALSDAVVVGMNLTIGYYDNAVASIPSSDIENKGVFNFNTSDGRYLSIAVPSILESVLQGNNQDIDLANSAVNAFATAITAGLASVAPGSIVGVDVVGVKEAYKQNRRSHVAGGKRKG